MPTTRIAGSLASSISSGCSCRQGAHQDAQTLTTVTRALEVGAGEARDRLPVARSGPSSGASAKAGAGRPIRAEGTCDGSPRRRAGSGTAAPAPTKTRTGQQTAAEPAGGSCPGAAARAGVSADGSVVRTSPAWSAPRRTSERRGAARFEVGERPRLRADDRARRARSGRRTISRVTAIGHDDEDGVRPRSMVSAACASRRSASRMAACARGGAGSRCACRRGAARRRAA